MNSALFGRNASLLVAVFTICAFANAMSAGAKTPQNDKTKKFTGVWTLNKSLSDDPAKMMEAMQSERQGGSGGGVSSSGQSGGHGPGMHGGGRDAGRGDAGQMRVQMLFAIQPPSRLTITQTESSITVMDGDGRSQTLVTNNKKQKLPLDSRTVEVKAKWDDGVLVKETSLDEGIKLTETYSLISEQRQLQVIVKLEGSHLPRPINLRRVYDAENTR